MIEKDPHDPGIVGITGIVGVGTSSANRLFFEVVAPSPNIGWLTPSFSCDSQPHRSPAK
jgi:hypothetical protein